MPRIDKRPAPVGGRHQAVTSADATKPPEAGRGGTSTTKPLETMAPTAGWRGLDAILRGVAGLRRSHAPEGREALLTGHAEARARRAFHGLGRAEQASLERALAGLSLIGRGILLRAVAAREGALAEPAGRADTLSLLSRFAGRLSELSDADIQRQATALDLDSTHNHSTFDPLETWSRRGQIHDPTRDDDDASDNDGLFQRFTGSCGSTVLQMALAEADPVFAFSLHDAGLTSDAITGPIADFQRDVLEAYGGVALGRVEAQLRSRLRNAVGRLGVSGEVTGGEKAALLRWALEGGGRKRDVWPTVQKLRTAFGGFPSDDDVARLRAERHPPRDEGIGTGDYLRALEEHLTPVTGVAYTSTNPPEGFARGQLYRHLADAERALRRGIDVPFGIAEPAHWMLLSAVKGRGDRRQWLVSDPDGGRTSWVSEAAFRSGEFAREPFLLPDADERPYVDCFILPALDDGPRSALAVRAGQ